MNTCFFLLLFPFTFPLHATWSTQTLQSMSLREKIGQLFVVRAISNFNQKNPVHAALLQEWLPTSNPEYVKMLIEKYHVGGVIFQLISTIDQHIDTINALQEISKEPLLHVCDLERGLTQRLEDGIRFPFNMTLGALRDESLIREMAQKIGLQSRAIGVHMNLAPVVDVNTNPLNPIIGMRSFGENADDVARKGVAYLQGLQDVGCAGCAKHGPIDHGDTFMDSHYDLPVVKEAKKRWKEVSRKPFAALVNHGVEGMITAHLHVPDYDNREHRTESLSANVIQGIIRTELQFKGLIITDALDMHAVTKHFKPGELELEAFLAGNDIMLCPNNVPVAVDLIEQLIIAVPELEAELNRRVLKILQLKERMGLHENRLVSKEQAHALMHDESTLMLKKRLYRQAVTLLKNDRNLLPLECASTQSIALVTIQSNTLHSRMEFTKTMRQGCTNSTEFFVDRNTAPLECERIGLELKNNYDIIIIGIFDLATYLAERNNRACELVDLIYFLKMHGKKVIITFFDSPYAAAMIPSGDALVMVYEDDIDAQCAAAEVILGAAKPMGALPVSISSQFVRGMGLTF